MNDPHAEDLKHPIYCADCGHVHTIDERKQVDSPYSSCPKCRSTGFMSETGYKALQKMKGRGY